MRISRVNRSRVSDILVSRQTVVSSVNSVEKSAPSFEIQNSTFNFSDNFWLSKEQFYDHLEKILHVLFFIFFPNTSHFFIDRQHLAV